MRCVAVVEIPSVGTGSPSPSENSVLSSRLLKAAYEASRRGVVMLLLPDGSDRAVDRELDPYVTANRHVHGVVYKHASDARSWRGLDRDALFIVSSPDSRAAADAIGARCIDADAGLLALQHLGAELPGTTGHNALAASASAHSVSTY